MPMTTEPDEYIREALLREVYDLRVYVVGGGVSYLKMFFDAGFRGARRVADANIVCFTGGEDVDPRLYGERALQCTRFNVRRDTAEVDIYADAVAAGKTMIGICRGSQFLNVMNGGRLWQDVNNHAIHQGHDVIDVKTGEIKADMTSTHHQQMRPADSGEILAVAELSTRKRSECEEIVRDKPDTDDVEVVWYPKTKSLCFQPHPEFRFGPCRDYFLSLVDQYVMPNC